MRYLYEYIQKDLKRKMVVVAGPRQSGKTTLAKAILKNWESGQYYNWDHEDDRTAIIDKSWNDSDKLIVFDEIHKRPKWKSWLKGIWDKNDNLHQFLITGSARLDIYRKGGDSMLGRYHYWRLYPFSLDEYPKDIKADEALKRLITVGGFPEPFISNDLDFARRWRKERFDRIIREDVRDLESIRELPSLSLMVDLLRRQVCSTVIASNLAQKIQVAPKTCLQWIDVIERMYLAFTVKPFVKNVSRAILKPKKIYFFDCGDVIGDEGAKFENLIAFSLLKRIHFIEDSQGYRMDLNYIRDKDGHEIDFAISRDGELEEIIEVKESDEAVSPNLYYFKERLGPKRTIQIVKNLKKSFKKNGVEVLTPFDYFSPSLW